MGFAVLNPPHAALILTWLKIAAEMSAASVVGPPNRNGLADYRSHLADSTADSSPNLRADLNDGRRPDYLPTSGHEGLQIAARRRSGHVPR